MRVIIQRVSSASVFINKEKYSNIKKGLLCYVAFCDQDNDLDFEWVINKLSNLKIFNNKSSLLDIKGDLLIVSQFTLFGSLKKGNNPSWSKASKPELAIKLYNHFIQLCKDRLLINIKTGFFGSEMSVFSINEGPFTLYLDTKQKE